MAPPLEAAAVKRFLELWQGDPAFRAAAARAPRIGQAFPLDVDPQALRGLWDREAPAPDPCAVPGLAGYRAELARLHGVRDRLTARLHAHGDPAYAAWRQRQIARTVSQTTPPSWINPHYPFAIELSVGCTIHCAYCCFDAPKLARVARHAAHAPLFAALLGVLQGFFGEAADTGFLYWATDPLDNPDYERYVTTFRACLGHVPRTTTAAWHRNIPRTKRLLALGDPHPHAGAHRFSINSLAQLHQCMQRFTPAELAHVHLAQQQDGSPLVRVAAGRGLRADPTAPRVSNADLSGFLLNLCTRTVQLITPCQDLTQWPLGYAVLRSMHFARADDLAAFLRTCADEVMAAQRPGSWVPRLRADLRMCVEGARVVLATACTALTYDHALEYALLTRVDGVRTLDAIVHEASAAHDSAALRERFARLDADGVFEELPAPPATR